MSKNQEISFIISSSDQKERRIRDLTADINSSLKQIVQVEDKGIIKYLQCVWAFVDLLKIMPFNLKEKFEMLGKHACQGPDTTDTKQYDDTV